MFSATATPSLQAQLRKAKPVEEEWCPAQYQEIGTLYPHLKTENNVQIDGLWRCHQCGHANYLIHYDGPHPFKKLKCVRCYHILCDVCPTSELLTRIPVRSTEVLESRSHESEQLAYCSVCQHCGLSHRATMRDGCLDFSMPWCLGCAHFLESGSTGYYIGSLVNFRRDPEGTAVMLKLKRLLGDDMKTEATSEVTVAAHTPPLTAAPAPARVVIPAMTPHSSPVEVHVHVHPPTPPSLPVQAECQHRREQVRPFTPPHACASAAQHQTIDLVEEVRADSESHRRPRHFRAQTEASASSRPGPQPRSTTSTKPAARHPLQNDPQTSLASEYEAILSLLKDVKTMDIGIARFRKLPMRSDLGEFSVAS
jgi:hypothetical protein